MKEKEILEKVKNDYNKISSHFNLTRQNDWREFELFKKYILEYLFLKPQNYKVKILDIGCGNGRFINFLKSLNINYEYIGIDNSEGQINEALNNSEANRINTENKIHFEIGDILNLSNFKEDEFDMVFCIAVFHHLPSKETRNIALKNIYKVLKKDGMLMMTSWNLFQLNYIKYLFDINKYKSVTDRSIRDMKTKKFNLLESFSFNFKDTFIPWKNEKGEVVSKRYYYAFNKIELRNLFVKNNFIILENKLTDDKNILEARNIISILQK